MVKPMYLNLNSSTFCQKKKHISASKNAFFWHFKWGDFNMCVKFLPSYIQYTYIGQLTHYVREGTPDFIRKLVS